MYKFIWILGLWLVGIAGTSALTLETPETLRYDVYWSMLRVGTAQLDYVPGKGTYVLRAVVKDDSSLLSLNDAWESRGLHSADKPFMPQIYSVKQAENSYRADKTMVFDGKTQRVVYTNNLDATDTADALPLSEARDGLATVYAWRLRGEQGVDKPETTPMVSLKRVITLKRTAGVATTVRVNGRDYPAWKVVLTTVKDSGKLGKGTWTVYLSRNAELVPLQIVAQTSFGTIKAVLAK